MLIRKATRKYKDRTYTNYLLVESVHTPKGPRQKVLCSLGDLSPRPAKAWLRLVHPASEHAMPAWIRATALEDILGVAFERLADDALYRNLDRLHAERAAIEAALGERERSLFNLEPTVFFYDLTSTYFEGQALANPKAKRGSSTAAICCVPTARTSGDRRHGFCT